MTATTIDRAAPAQVARTAPAPIPFHRLMSVELIKMFNTRAGFWLMMSMAGTALHRDRVGDPLRAGQRDDLRQLRRGRSASR